jgi:signal transduction histidine kinase
VDALIASGAPVPSLEESELVADLVPEEIAAAEVLAGEPHEAAPSTPAAAPVPDAALRRLAGAVAHEVRNPLTAIRTFAELLPAHHDDEEFRTRFAELVSRDVLRIEDVVERLGRVAALGPPEPDDVDVTALLEELLELRRAAVRERHLLVLKELDPGRPLARGDRRQLRLAFEALLDGALAAVPERGDVYLASRHHAAGLRGEPSVRVLVRFRGPERAGAPPLAGTSPAENALDFAIAELLVRAQGGALALDTSDAEESVVVLDLPAR